MNIEKLLDALGNIHPKYIKEAEEEAIRALRTRRKWRYRQLGLLASAAACVGIVVLAAQMGLFSPRGGMEAAPEETTEALEEGFVEEAVEEAAPEEGTEALEESAAVTEEREEASAEGIPVEEIREEDSEFRMIEGALGKALSEILKWL